MVTIYRPYPFIILGTVDEGTLNLNVNVSNPPDWTKLEKHQCAHSPLSPDKHPHCPLAAAMYYLAQHFRDQECKSVDNSLDGLLKLYDDIHILNAHFIERLRDACNKDATINALITLDLFTAIIPFAVSDSLDELKPLFKPYLENK
jgi:hypothetical protein